jgi:hypothetical protein
VASDAASVVDVQQTASWYGCPANSELVRMRLREIMGIIMTAVVSAVWWTVTKLPFDLGHGDATLFSVREELSFK